ncbi:MAG: precorrin-3B C(17)-methyltransferase [Actinomycetota bacterium]|nr:precorrin-3B C(17)-methyltransferase [Actinomycetota bacterium]
MTRVGHVAVTAAGRRRARDLVDRCGGDVLPGPAADAVRAGWETYDALVCHLAVGAVTRLVGPLLTDKRDDPAVVCVDESGRYVVPLLGGHAGANALAERIADAIGATAVVTTATDATGLPGLDDLGWPCHGDVAGVTRALLDGEPVRFESEHTWPLPALATQDPADGPAGEGGPTIVVSDRDGPVAARSVVLRPPSLVVGVGASRGAPTDEVRDLVMSVLYEAGLSRGSVAALVTVDLKADEPALCTLADELGVPLRTFGAPVLAEQPVPNPSSVVADEVGTPSVAEAAVLAAGAALVVEKAKSSHATVAVGRVRPRGRLSIVGLGPGARDLLAPRARAAIRRASVVVGLDQYVEQVRDLLRPGTRVLASGLGAEEERARTALEQARLGHAVALVCSGDAGLYAMASPTLELGVAGVDVDVVPGITASLAASALVGAPLGHDHALVSLSDLHTPWPAIERRLRAVAEGDLVVALYNPRSRRRTWQLPKALGILAAHRPPSTPVAVVHDATRGSEQVQVSTLAEIDPETVTMRSVVLVGASTTRVVDGQVVTPRGYQWLT